MEHQWLQLFWLQLLWLQLLWLQLLCVCGHFAHTQTLQPLSSIYFVCQNSVIVILEEGWGRGEGGGNYVIVILEGERERRGII